MVQESLSPTISSNLYLLRHGESTCNTVHRIAGICDVPLNRLGLAQAQKAGLTWHCGSFDLVFVSDLRRARQTAEMVCAKMEPKPLVTIEPKLAERDFGSYTLQNKAVLQRRFGVPEYERAMNSDSPTMEAGEEIALFRRRVEDFYHNTLLPELRKGRRVLVVSHKYVIEFLARLILGLPLTGAYDLRLPNSQFLPADTLHSYLSQEVKWRNQLYDMITVNYHIVFVMAVILGFLLHISGLEVAVSPYILIALLAAATAIGFTTVEIEEVGHYLARRDILLANVCRFVLVPVVGLVIVSVAGLLSSPLALTCLAFLAAPAGVLAVTASRCAGGLILPALATVVISSLVSILPLGLLLGSGAFSEVPAFVAICFLVFAASVFLPYGLILALRARWPIRTAKFGSRNGHLAVLLLAVYIVLAMLNIDLSSALTAGLTATSLALLVKLVTMAAIGWRGLFAVDYFSAMTYPNAFVLVIIGGLLELPVLGHVATWYLLPMSVLAVLDGPFARACAERTDRLDLQRLLRVPEGNRKARGTEP